MTDRLGEALDAIETASPEVIEGQRGVFLAAPTLDQVLLVVNAARAWHTLTNPTDELIERVADLAGERNGFWQIPPVAAAYIAAAVDALSVTPTTEETR